MPLYIYVDSERAGRLALLRNEARLHCLIPELTQRPGLLVLSRQETSVGLLWVNVAKKLNTAICWHKCQDILQGSRHGVV